eukprot:6486687-Ditylum_brightwellii.AAC.1
MAYRLFRYFQRHQAPLHAYFEAQLLTTPYMALLMPQDEVLVPDLNGVDAIEHKGKQGNLVDAEVFMLGDNMVREATYYWGSSTDKLLHAEGTDGVSHGNMAEGVMHGVDMM